MRPDEHKKKISAQYKKKHGMPASKKPTGGKTSDTGSSSGRWNTGETSSRQLHKGATIPESQGCDKSLDEQQKPETHFVREKANFQRREVASNWSRYEGLDEVSQPELRGADFSQLVAATGDALSRFRFKDEQEWETIDQESTQDDLLSLDCQGLATMLGSVPLRERLQIEHDAFESTQIEHFEEIAGVNYKNLPKQETNTQTDTSVSSTGSVVNTQETSGTVTDTNKTMADNVKKSTNEPDVCDSDDILDDLLNDIDSCKPAPAAKHSEAIAQTSALKKSHNVPSADEELDFLLSLDSEPAKSTVIDKKNDAIPAKVEGPKRELNDNNATPEKPSTTTDSRDSDLDLDKLLEAAETPKKDDPAKVSNNITVTDDPLEAMLDDLLSATD